MNRRAFIRTAASLGATAAFGDLNAAPSRIAWRERRDFFPEGVASGDPDASSALLWTRAPHAAILQAEVASDAQFEHVVATANTPVSANADFTCRVLVGGLKPASVYWYRFSDPDGNGSRIGRTITAPAANDPRPVSFAFVSCQNANQGAQNAYRRMIFEDERARESDRLFFVLHLGDFIYEIVWYPEDRPQGMYDRRLRDIVRYPSGEKIRDLHIPTTLDDYRAVYRAYLHDPDLQDARARWPFVNMWDNHEFSWLGWQSLQKFYGETRPAQTRKVAANQAFFEFQPARMARPHATTLERFEGPHVEDSPITAFDVHGLGQEPNNLAAIASLKGYRALRFGRHVDLIVTDQRSYCSEEPSGTAAGKALVNDAFPQVLPQEILERLDAGPPYTQTILGAEQKAWFLGRLKNSRATWKIWGNTTATLDMRADMHNLPAGVGQPWHGAGYAAFPMGDWSTAYTERGEIYDFIRDHGIIGFATVSGDRHSFWAGLASKSLPPRPFAPVGVAFVTGSISAPTMVEALEYGLPKDQPLRALYVGRGPHDNKPQPTLNLLLRHGVRACLEYAQSGDIAKAHALSNRDLAPHVSFVDMGGHGYTVVRASARAIESEFVCIPRPLERSESADGGPLLYRVRCRSSLWTRSVAPKLEVEVVEGNPRFSL